MRNLTKTLVAVSLLTSTSVHSLGIGGIKLRSALNQKLNAEIALVTSGGENVGDIQVKLASPAKFDEAGVPWGYFLTKIKFTPITKADGSVGVKLSSDEVLKEPYLDFLVEVTGPSGTLFREFTVLVDPPASYKKPVVPVVTRHAEPTSAPVDDFDAPVPQVESSMPDRESRVADDNIRYEHATGDYNSSTGEYGPTQKSDTIWSIANQVKPDDVSTEQMVMAIYAANKRAFAKPNVNRLLAGKMLEIPDHDAVLNLSRHQAAGELKQASHRSHVNTRPNERADMEHKFKPASSESAVVKVHKPFKRLKLNPPTADGEIAENGDATEALKGAVSNEQPNLAAISAEDADLKQRFEKIENQLQMMQKMLELKDAQLATLQKTNADVPPANTELKLAEPVKTESEADVSKLATQPPPENKLEPALATKPVPEAKVVTPAPVVKPDAVKSGLPEIPAMDLFADYYWLGGGIGASLLAALGLIWWRKRKVEKTIDTESMFASASQISLPDTDKQSAAEQTSGYEVGMVGDSAFLSEFTPSEFDAFETDQTEIDPLSEADVYLAYGRYQQAEELIRQVITEHPNRNDCKLKLLEIFHTSENKPALDKYVQQLINEGKQSDTVFWAKASEIINEFPPKNPTEGAPIVSTSAASVAKNNFAQIDKPENDFKPVEDAFDFDLNELSDAPVSPVRSVKFDKATAKPESVIPVVSDIFSNGIDSDAFLMEDADFMNDESVSNFDFDLNTLVAESLSTDEEHIEYIDEDGGNGLDFNLDSFDEAFKTKSDVLAAEPKIDSFDFDLADYSNKEAQALEMFDFNMSDEQDESIRDLDFSTANLNVETASKAVDTLSDADEMEEFDFDFDLPTGKASKKNQPFDELEIADGLDDKTGAFETKVNLANAYVDMGDVDAAKVIANDLLKGTAEQKKAGQEILEKIS